MSSEQKDVPRHPIRIVSRRTGLTPAVLRAWEKRYGVVDTARTEGGQRLYSDEDVRRLTLLRKVVGEGRSISRVAGLSLEQLKGLVQEDEAGRQGPPLPEALGSGSASELLEEASRWVDRLDPAGLERALTRGAMALSVPAMLDQVVAPLLHRVGSSWQEGRLGPAQEHVASVVIRRFLDWLLSTVSVGPSAPLMVAATPSGERHELGALLAAVTAAAEGWRAVFLGPDLPASEIASAASALKAEVVALSSVDPASAGRFQEEVLELRSRLPAGVRLFVGGANAPNTRQGLEREGIEVLGSLEDLRRSLRRTRAGV